MAKIIEARAVISAEDRTGAVFDKVAHKFDALAKSTKAAQNVSRLTNSLKDADAQLRAIDKFNHHRDLFADARTRFRDAQVGIEKASRAMAAAEKPTRAMENAYKRAQQAVSSASKAFDEQKSAVIGARRALDTSGIPISKISSEQRRLATHVERTTRALRQQRQINEGTPLHAEHARAPHPQKEITEGAPLHAEHARVLHQQRRQVTEGTPLYAEHTRALHQQREIVDRSPAEKVARRAATDRQSGKPDHTALPIVGETGGLYGGTRVAKHAIKEGTEMQHERVRMEAAGMKPEEIESAEKEATHLSKKYLPVSQTQIMHLLRNTRSVVGDYHEASEIADPLLALRVVAMGAHPEKSEELNEDFDKLVKGMEIKGVTQDKPKFEHYIDNIAKSVNVFGDTLRPTDFYEMFKYGRAATNALGDDFMLSTAPTLAQELGGSSAGKALSSFHTQFVGGKMSNRAVEQLSKYDMLDQKKIIKTKTGNVKGVLPGGIIGQEYLKPGQEDPYEWVNKALLPHLAKKGITDPSQIQEVISSMASQQTTAQMMSIFATQQPRIQKDKALIKGAKGIDAAPTFMRNDPKIGAKSITTQADNILQNATSPAMRTVAPVMNSFAGSLAEIAEDAKENPATSTVASAGALSGIMAGSAKGASWLLPMLFGNMPEGGIMKAIGSTAGTALKWGARGSGVTTAAMLGWDAYQNRDELGRNLVGKGDHATTGDTLKTGYERDHPTDTLDRLRRERDDKRYYRMPIVNKAMTYDGPTGIGEKPNWGAPTATSSAITVSGTVDGNAKLEITITAPDVLKVMEKAEAVVRMAGQLQQRGLGNGPGSTGRSSPDAGAPPTGFPSGGHH